MILVVASDGKVAEELVKLISSAGYKANAEKCGQEISALVRFTKPQLVIIDCELDDAFTIVKNLRGDTFTRDSSLLMFAVAGENWRDRALAAGADAFVTKGGLDWAELLENIHNFVGAPPQKDRAEEV